MKYTIRDFRKQFPNDKTCLTYIFKQRFPKGADCPKCKHEKCYYPVTDRRCYACSWCGHQIHVTADTIFHKSSTLLTLWFYAIYLMSQSKNGVSAKELERQLGVTYKCAWRIARQIRKLMAAGDTPLSGTIEIDETTVRGKRPGKQGRAPAGKTIVIGMVERGGAIKTKTLRRIKQRNVEPIIRKSVEKGSQINTDQMGGYARLEALGYEHNTVNHSKGERVRGTIHTQTIDGFWSQMKRSINGTYHSVSPQHLQAYADEFSFRYSHRDDGPLPLVVFPKVGQTS